LKKKFSDETLLIQFYWEKRKADSKAK